MCCQTHRSIPPSNRNQGRGGRGRNHRGSGRDGGCGRGTYPPGPCFYCGKGGHQLVGCAEKIAKKPSIATLASLETLETIEQKENWMDDPILVAVAKSNLAVLRAQEGIRERVFRIRGVLPTFDARRAPAMSSRSHTKSQWALSHNDFKALAWRRSPSQTPLLV